MLRRTPTTLCLAVVQLRGNSSREEVGMHLIRISFGRAYNLAVNIRNARWDAGGPLRKRGGGGGTHAKPCGAAAAPRYPPQNTGTSERMCSIEPNPYAKRGKRVVKSGRDGRDTRAMSSRRRGLWIAAAHRGLDLGRARDRDAISRRWRPRSSCSPYALSSRGRLQHNNW